VLQDWDFIGVSPGWKRMLGLWFWGWLRGNITKTQNPCCAGITICFSPKRHKQAAP
jgi:hypothetical protein